MWRGFSNWNIHNKPSFEISPEIENLHLINNFFRSTTVACDIGEDLLHVYNSTRFKDDIEPSSLDQITVETLKTTLNFIKSNAHGIDGINLIMLKCAFEYCEEAILDIVNSSLSCGVVPRIWKQAFISSLPKIPQAIELKQLRPINVLPTMSKLLENSVAGTLMNHANEHEIIQKVQSGFRKSHGTTTALMRITNDVTRNIDNFLTIYTFLLDYSEAFNMVDHSLLLVKLKYYGLSASASQWFQSYLAHRTQCVKIGQNVSDNCEVKCGVSQGSI
ncbi:hypothetical protein JTB14_037974 [Gonioctena quinquepunctata]|nr:hypothetical protein JTB14_037974 [Gonioctena quinquepunctata]